MQVPTLSPSPAKFRFGGDARQSLGLTSLHLQTLSDINPIRVRCDVVDVDISSLLGLEVMYKHHLLLDTISNKLVNHKIIHKNGNEPSHALEHCHFPLKRIDNPVYVQMSVPYNVLFTCARLQKIRIKFFHASFEKIFKVIPRAQPNLATPEILKNLKRYFISSWSLLNN